MSILSAGKAAPGFTLASSTGKPVSLSDFKGQTVILYFYPRADTPGCTVEACGFNDAMPRFSKAKVPVLGISPDPEKAVAKFARKFKLNFPLLADADHAVAEAYGVWQKKSMFGKKYMGVVRTTFVIGSDGQVLHVFENVKVEGHEKAVLDWLAAHVA